MFENIVAEFDDDMVLTKIMISADAGAKADTNAERVIFSTTKTQSRLNGRENVPLMPGCVRWDFFF